MTDETLPVLHKLEQQIERVAEGAGRRRRPRRRAFALALVATGSLTAGALAATGVLTGEPVKDPAGVPRQSPTVGEGVVRPATVRLSALRVADPDGGPAWGLRTLSTTRAVGCLQLGRVVGNQLGVLGQDGAFENDGRFHSKPATLVTERECQPLDGAGRLYAAISMQGIAASASTGCSITRPHLPPGMPAAPHPLPLCPHRDLRIIYYGTLGPRATSVSYLDDDGRMATARTEGPLGAYLVVLRPSARHPAKGYYVPSRSPGSGLLAVHYRGAPTCHIRSARSLGGAKLCPTVGFTPIRVAKVTAAQVASPVSARFAPRPVRLKLPPGEPESPPEWKLTLSFTARVAATATSHYTVEVAPDHATRCRSGRLLGPVARDVRVGQRVTVTEYVPGRCQGRVRGRVAFHQPGPKGDPAPFGGFSPRDPLVGEYELDIPG